MTKIGGETMDNIFSEYKVNYNYKNDLINNFCQYGIKKIFSPHSFIEFEHKKLNHIYLILEGKVKQYFIDINGEEKTILILSRGDIFGEITLIQEDYDLVMTKALENTIVRKIDKNKFYQVLKENPNLYNSLLLMITTKFRILMAQIYDSSFHNIKNRLLFLLKRLSIQQGIKTKVGIKINIKLTHEQLAAMIGSTRSTVTKKLNELEEEDKIRRIKGNIHVL